MDQKNQNWSDDFFAQYVHAMYAYIDETILRINNLIVRYHAIGMYLKCLEMNLFDWCIKEISSTIKR